MRPEKLALGRSRRCSLAGRIREKIKRFLSVAVSVSVITCSMPAIPAMAATDDDDVQEFTLTVNDLCDAVETALKGGESISESAYVFKGDAQETYEDLFYGADVYEIEPEFEKSGSNDLSLKVFVRLGADREIDSDEITGEEEIVFLLLNRSDEEATARIMIDEYETGLITVAPKSDVAAEEVELEETDISTLSASAGGSAGDGSEETADEEADDKEDTDEAGEADADAEEDDEEPAEEEKPDDSKADAPEDKDSKDTESEKPDDHRADDKGKDHEAGKESDSGDKDAEKPGSDDKADHNESKDKGYGDFTGGSHDKGDKADGNDGSADKVDKSNSADKADSSDSKDDGDKAETKDNSSARASRSSRNSNYLKAALGDAEDDAEEDDKAETEDADIDDTPEIIIEIDEEDDEIAASIDEGEDEASIVSLAAYEEVEDDDEIASASDAKEAKAGYTLIEGETYEAVVVNHSRSGVAYETTLQQLGIDYGIQLFADGEPIYLNGSSGNDANSGTTSSSAVKTVGKAIELAKENKTANIYVEGAITVTENEEWNGLITFEGDNGATETTTVTLIWDNFTNKPMIQVTDGTLTLSNIIIDGNNKSVSYAVILVNGSKAELDIKDGTIIRNHTANYSSNPNCTISVSNGKVNMSGGEICYNTSLSGTYYISAGIMLYAAQSDSVTEFNMSGGSIHDNESLNSNGSYGGGVLVKAANGGEASMNLSGGQISNNNCAGNGGGVALYMASQAAYRSGSRISFEMTGGSISNNKAGYYGGGLYVGTSTTATIEGGIISGNEADGNSWSGGGIYINGGQYVHGEDSSMGNVPGELYLYNVEIAGNESLGGSYASIISCCPTGNVDINITEGAVIHDNETGDTRTIYYEAEDTSDVFIISPVMLGGAAYHWYDEYGNEIDLSNLTVTSESASENSFSATTDASVNIADSVSGINRCVTHINGNKAIMGAAIGTNGNVIIGTDDGDVTIYISKEWDSSISEEEKQDVVVEIYATDGSGEQTYIGKQTLYEENDWGATITNLPKYDSDGIEYTYTINEKPDAEHNFSAVINGGKVDDDGNSAIYKFTVRNTIRDYFDIDEEIIPNMDDAEHPETWEKNESVTEYGALEFEMSTRLPVITPEDIAAEDSDFTMYFHNKLDEGLRLDAAEEDDLHITIGGKTIENTDEAEYYTIDISETADRWDPSVIAPYALVDGDDECTFHVTVNLSKLYADEVITDDDLTGDTEIIIYFYVDLEGQGMDGVYTSTVQYQIFDNNELLYTSSESVVYIYTYEIGISKEDSSTGNSLAGATFGVYYDEACTQPVMRYGENYIVISDENGEVLFYGLAAGTYYLKELEAPEGYVLTTEVFKVVVGEEVVDISNSTSLTAKELDGAVFGVYYDEDCSQQVSVDGVHYTVTSDSEGNIIFDGIAAGRYYLKLVDSEGNQIGDEVITVNLEYDTFTYGNSFTVGNTPSSSSGGTGGSGSGHHSSGGGGGGSSSSGGSGSVVGGPGSGDSGAGDGENYYPLDTMPQTGDPGATKSLFMMILGFGALLVISVVDRKKKKIMD